MVEMETKTLVPFLEKTYEMVDDPNTNDLISWNHTKQSFIISNQHNFSGLLLRKHFKHDNFSSFVHQLNDYGFKKVSYKEPCEYYHKFFQQGRKDLLYYIKRQSVLKKEKHKAKPTVSAFNNLHLIESEYVNLKDIHQKLKNDINELRRECENLKKQLANARSKEEIVKLVMKALSNPSILQQIKIIVRNKTEESDEQVTKKPRLSEEIDKSQDAFEPNNLHCADKRSEAEPKTKALSMDSPNVYCGDYFALEEIEEFLQDNTAFFQNASQNDLDGEWNAMHLMELITEPPVSVEMKTGIEDEKMVRLDNGSSNSR